MEFKIKVPADSVYSEGLLPASKVALSFCIMSGEGIKNFLAPLNEH